MLPDIRLGPLSKAAQEAVSEIETITSETASSAVPLYQSTQAKATVSGPQTKQYAAGNSNNSDGEVEARVERAAPIEATEGECVARYLLV